MSNDTQTRLVVVPVIKDERQRVLLCKMPPDRGVFPGKWGLPGGGVEPGERIDEALAREVAEDWVEANAQSIWSFCFMSVISLQLQQSP
jgi:nucleoside triphosphatase